MCFSNENTGTAVGESTTILRTTDGGENWSAQSCALSIILFDVSFCNENNGVACGTLGSIICTTNGGGTWITYQTGWMMQYYAALMQSSLVSVLVGENSIFSPMVTWTLDGWQSHTTKGFLLNNNEGQLWDVHYSSSSTWYAAAIVWNGQGAIARTVDGGNNWDTIYWTNRGFCGMDFPTSNVGYAVGIGGIIIKTIDGGNNWNLIESGVTTTLLDVSFATEACGTVVGENGLILRTEDGGDSWVTQESGTYSDLHAVQLIDSKNGFIVGEGGVILHTTTGGYAQDNDPPVTTCELDGTMSGGVYTSDVEVSLNATDPGSGVNYTMVKLDSGQWSTYSQSFIVSDDGNHTVYFYSVDLAGNVEQQKNRSFTILHPEPRLILTISGGLGINVLITNMGFSDAKNVNWSITVKGGILGFINKVVNNTIDNIPPMESVSVSSGMFFGIGSIDITAKAENEEITEKGFQLFIFSIVK